MAEGVRFELTVTQRATTVFETAPIVHSGTPPQVDATDYNTPMWLRQDDRPAKPAHVRSYDFNSWTS